MKSNASIGKGKQMNDTYSAYAKRLHRKLDILRLDAKASGNAQLVHDLGECMTLLAKLEKAHEDT